MKRGEVIAELLCKWEHIPYGKIKYNSWIIMVGANYMDEIKFTTNDNELGFPTTPEPEIRDIGFDISTFTAITDFLKKVYKKIKHN